MIKHSLSNYKENKELEVYTWTTVVSIFGITIYKTDRVIFRKKGHVDWKYARNGEFVFNYRINGLILITENSELFENKKG